MTNMYIRTKEAFTRKGTGGLETYAFNTVYQVDTTLGNSLISAGLASAETLITPTGKVSITSTAEVNVTDYAKAQVVDANLVAGNIKKDVVILGTTGTYEAPASDFSTATVTISATGAETFTVNVSDLITVASDGDDEYLSGEGIQLDETTSSAEVSAVLLNSLASAGISATVGTISDITATGNIEISHETGALAGWFASITGDGTITVTLSA